MAKLQEDNLGLRKENKDLKNDLHKQKEGLSLKDQQIKMLKQQIQRKDQQIKDSTYQNFLVKDKRILNFKKRIKAISKIKPKFNFSLNT